MGLAGAWPTDQDDVPRAIHELEAMQHRETRESW